MCQFKKESCANAPKRTACAFLSVIMVSFSLSLPAWADNYDERYSAWDNSWSGGQDWNFDGNAISSSTHDSYGGNLQVAATASSIGEAWAKAWVQRDFYYDSEHTYWNFLEIKYDIHGVMDRVPNGESRFYTRMELWDLTSSPDELLHFKYSTSYESDTESVEKYNLSSSFSSVLTKGRQYRVKFIAYAWCRESSGMGSAGVDFYDDLLGYAVTVNELNVWHEHAETGTGGGDQTPYRADQTFLFKQNKYDFADELTFNTYTGDTTADELEGWWYKIYSFDDSTSNRVSPKKAHGRTWVTTSPDIPYDHDVRVRVTHWFNHSPTDSCGNCISVEGVSWDQAEKGTQTKSTAKAVPDHGWAILYPLPVEGQPDQYSHTFIIKNSDPTELLDIRSLTFLATMDEYEDLCEIEFPDDAIHNLSLTPGGDWSVNIITDTPLFGGYIYFMYSIYDPIHATDLCSAWGSHYVAAPLEEDKYEIPAPTGGLVTLSLDAGKDNGSRFFAVLLGMSGCAPGTTLPGGLHMDLNMDMLTQMMLGAGYPFGMLSPSGKASVPLPFGPMPLPVDLPLFMTFVCPYQAPTGWYTSNCVSLIIRA